MNRGCAPQEQTRTPASLVPREDGSAWGYGRIADVETAVQPEGAMTRRNSQTRTPLRGEGGGGTGQEGTDRFP